MRYLLVIILVFASLFEGYSQITLENSYRAVPLRRSYTQAQFYLSEIDQGVYKYIYYDGTQSFLKLYNLNHTLYKNITLPSSRLSGTSSKRVACLYVSRSLFDCDSTNVEYMLTSDNLASGSSNAVEIYRENGDTVLMLKHASLSVINTLHMVTQAIQQTPGGTKMLIEKYRWTQTSNIFDTLQVYSLCGSLPTNIYPNPSAQKTSISSRAYPNPTSEVITIEYELENGKQASLELFGSNGSRIKQYTIDSNFNNVRLNLEEEGLRSGMYYYTITTTEGEQLTKKFIKIN